MEAELFEGADADEVEDMLVSLCGIDPDVSHLEKARMGDAPADDEKLDTEVEEQAHDVENALRRVVVGVVPVAACGRKWCL